MLVTYALRNALLPVVTTLGMVFSFLLGANVLVEKVFAWPGIGSYALEALIASDYAPVQGFVLMMALALRAAEPGHRHRSTASIDPRVRIEGVKRASCGTRRYVLGENPVTLAAFALFVAPGARAPCSARGWRPTTRSPATPRARWSRRRCDTGSAPISSAAIS